AADGNEPVKIKLHKSLRLWTFYVDLEESLGTLESTRGDHKYFEDAFKAPAEVVKPLYLQYAKLEEDFGLAKKAMEVYDRATKAVPASEQWSMYEIYIARAAEIYSVPKTQEIYEQAISSGLPKKDAMKMCIKYAEFEKSLGEIDRARKIYVDAS
nr:pre-mRNA-splicing factor SYF1 [Tanacetum cinerariifolium]